MTDRQVFRFFGVERDEEGRPKSPNLGAVKSDREMFAYRCFLGGVYDRETVARLWRDEQAARRREADR
jgi:hypothetical protein